MKKYRIFSLIAAVLIVVISCSTVVSAADEKVFVTIANGDLVLAYAEVALTDADGDGALTVNDALIAAHDSAFEGGAEAGYTSENTDYGLSMTKLWGVENGGSYGYYVNNASAVSLADPVKSGDHIVAYVYTDTAAYSDTYSFFDLVSSTDSGLTLTLSAAGYDENWAPITYPIEGATITVNGKASEYKTDAAGKVTVVLDGTGTFVISATSDTVTLVPPVYVVTVEEVEAVVPSAPIETAPETGYETFALAAVAVCALAFVVFRRRTHA